MNSSFPSCSARRAAWLLAGRAEGGPVPSPSRAQAGEMERLELVAGIAEHMRDFADPAEMATCVRLLEHLRGPIWSDPVSLWLQ